MSLDRAPQLRTSDTDELMRRAVAPIIAPISEAFGERIKVGLVETVFRPQDGGQDLEAQIGDLRIGVEQQQRRGRVIIGAQPLRRLDPWVRGPRQGGPGLRVIEGANPRHERHGAMLLGFGGTCVEERHREAVRAGRFGARDNVADARTVVTHLRRILGGETIEADAVERDQRLGAIRRQSYLHRPGPPCVRAQRLQPQRRACRIAAPVAQPNGGDRRLQAVDLGCIESRQLFVRADP